MYRLLFHPSFLLHYLCFFPRNSLPGHCTFEGGMCGWTNQEEGDDFDWILARGSDNFFTGPARDFYSFSKEYPLGGFIYIDASYPRRPGDRAMLVSPSFEPTGKRINRIVIYK